MAVRSPALSPPAEFRIDCENAALNRPVLARLAGVLDMGRVAGRPTARAEMSFRPPEPNSARLYRIPTPFSPSGTPEASALTFEKRILCVPA